MNQEDTLAYFSFFDLDFPDTNAVDAPEEENTHEVLHEERSLQEQKEEPDAKKRDNSAILTDEWVAVFEDNLKNQNSETKNIIAIIVKNIHPVFVWKSARLNRVKLRAQLAPYNFATQVIVLADGKYEFKLSKNHKKIFARLIADLNNMEGDSWQEKWKNVLDGKLKLENITQENKLQEGKESSLKLTNKGASSKRRYEELNSRNCTVPSKVYRPNEHSSLIRMDGISQEIKSVPLQDGQGICLNDDGNICVLDNGNGIHIYNENLEKIKTISFFVSCGVGLTFSNNTFYVATPLKNCVLKADHHSIHSRIFVPNPMSVRVHCGGTYILCGNNLTYILPSLESESTPVPIVLFEHKQSIMSNFILEHIAFPDLWFDIKQSMVTFSDFIIVDNIAFILDSVAGDIYKYDLVTGELKLVKIPENPPSGNPQCICSYEHNQILVSETDNHKISSFLPRSSFFARGDYFQYIGDYPLKDFQPNKITTKGRYIFTTALRDTRYQHQPSQYPHLNISADNFRSSAYQPELSPFNSCEKKKLKFFESLFSIRNVHKTRKFEEIG